MEGIVYLQFPRNLITVCDAYGRGGIYLVPAGSVTVSLTRQ